MNARPLDLRIYILLDFCQNQITPIEITRLILPKLRGNKMVSIKFLTVALLIAITINSILGFESRLFDETGCIGDMCRNIYRKFENMRKRSKGRKELLNKEERKPAPVHVPQVLKQQPKINAYNLLPWGDRGDRVKPVELTDSERYAMLGDLFDDSSFYSQLNSVPEKAPLDHTDHELEKVDSYVADESSNSSGSDDEDAYEDANACLLEEPTSEVLSEHSEETPEHSDDIAHTIQVPDYNDMSDELAITPSWEATSRDKDDDQISISSTSSDESDFEEEFEIDVIDEMDEEQTAADSAPYVDDEDDSFSISSSDEDTSCDLHEEPAWKVPLEEEEKTKEYGHEPTEEAVAQPAALEPLSNADKVTVVNDTTHSHGEEDDSRSTTFEDAALTFNEHEEKPLEKLDEGLPLSESAQEKIGDSKESSVDKHDDDKP